MLEEISSTRTVSFEEDQILPVTRLLAVFIIPFLIAAAVILLIFPGETGRLFAWPIAPPMSAMMLGAAYTGGIYFFTRVALAQRWHAIKAGFLPVTSFAGLLGVATILHWDRFTHNHISFFAWSGLYFTTPFLVIGVWLLNRRLGPGQPAAGEVLIPAWLRGLLAVAGIVDLLVGLALFIQPALMVAIWPWKLTPLTARVVGTMFVLPGVSELAVASDRRWSAARAILESQAVSILLILISALRPGAGLDWANPVAWLFTGGLAGLLVLLAALYLGMQMRRA